MEYNVTSSKTEKFGTVGPSVKMTIEANVKAFRTLVDSIYPDKIASPIRELMTNALDAHIEAGCPERPFEVTLPNVFDPVFRVRDFGKSMSEELINTVYSVLFCSTKDKTNDVTGMYGIGSKSPYAYCDSFGVTCFQHGKVRVYEWGLDAQGAPDLIPMAVGDTDEEDGVEISFTVREDDFRTFREKLAEIALGFDVQPIFKCGSEDELKLPVPYLVGKNFKFFNEVSADLRKGVFVRQGPVLYPVSSSYSVRRATEKFHGIFDMGGTLIVDVNIGDCEVTVARDSLAYTERTIANVATALKLAYDELKIHYTTNLDQIDDFETACIEWIENHYLYERFNVPKVWKGREIKVRRFNKDAEAIVAKIRYGGMRKLRKDDDMGMVGRLTDFEDHILTIDKYKSKNTYVFVAESDDRKTTHRLGNRVVHYFQTMTGKSLIDLEDDEFSYIILKTAPKVAYDVETLSKAMNDFDPAKIIHMNSIVLPKQKRADRVKEIKSSGPYFYITKYGSRRDQSEAPTAGHYVKAKGRSEVILNGKEYDYSNIYSLKASLTSLGFEGDKVFVIPKCHDALTSLPDMVDLNTVIPDEFKKLYSREQAVLALATTRYSENRFTSSQFREYFELFSNKHIGAELLEDANVQKFNTLITACNELLKVADDIERVEIIYDIYGITKKETDEVNATLQQMEAQFLQDYPLVGEIDLGYEHVREKCIDYIKQVRHYKSLLNTITA